MSSCLSCCPRRTQILSWDFLWIAIYSNESMLQAIVRIVQDGLVFNHYQTLDIVNLHWPYWINRSSLITFQLTRGVEVSHILWEVKSPSSRQVLNKMLNSLRQPTCLWVHQQVSFPFSRSLSRCEVHLLTALVTQEAFTQNPVESFEDSLISVNVYIPPFCSHIMLFNRSCDITHELTCPGSTWRTFGHLSVPRS